MRVQIKTPETKPWVKKAKKKYPHIDYSKTSIRGERKTSLFTCTIHKREFRQHPSTHMKYGCPYCSGRHMKVSVEEFIRRAKIKHGDKYDYSRVEFNNLNDRIIVGLDGEWYEQIANNHLRSNVNKRTGSKRKDKLTTVPPVWVLAFLTTFYHAQVMCAVAGMYCNLFNFSVLT